MDELKQLGSAITGQIIVALLTAIATSYIMTIRHDEQIKALRADITAIKTQVTEEARNRETRLSNMEIQLAKLLTFLETRYGTEKTADRIRTPGTQAD